MYSSAENLAAKYYVTQGEDTSSGHVHVYSKRRNSFQVPAQRTYEFELEERPAKEKSFINQLRRNSVPCHLQFEKKTDYDPNCIICQARPHILVSDEFSSQEDDEIEISLPAPIEIPSTPALLPAFLTPVEEIKPAKTISFRRPSLPVITEITPLIPTEQNAVVKVKSTRRASMPTVPTVPILVKTLTPVKETNVAPTLIMVKPSNKTVYLETENECGVRPVHFMPISNNKVISTRSPVVYKMVNSGFYPLSEVY